MGLWWGGSSRGSQDRLSRAVLWLLLPGKCCRRWERSFGSSRACHPHPAAAWLSCHPGASLRCCCSVPKLMERQDFVVLLLATLPRLLSSSSTLCHPGSWDPSVSVLCLQLWPSKSWLSPAIVTPPCPSPGILTPQITSDSLGWSPHRSHAGREEVLEQGWDMGWLCPSPQSRVLLPERGERLNLP